MPSTVVGFSDMAPSPRVDITIDDADLLGGTTSITIWQQTADAQVPVRNGVQQSAIGGFFVTDYEVPLGVPVEYRVQCFNGATSLGYVLSMVVTVSIPVGLAIVQDPLAPAAAVACVAEAQFGKTLTQEREAAVYLAGGETIALMGELGGLRDVPLHLITDTEADRQMLLAVLAEGYLLVRTMPPMALPRALHAIVSAIPRREVDAAQGGETYIWNLSGQQVSRSELDVLKPVVTWQRIIDAYDSWTELIAAHPTWLDLIQNPPPEA